MIFVIKIAAGLWLGYFGLRCWARFSEWRQRSFEAKITRPTPVRPPYANYTAVYKPAVPGVEYDRYGLAITPKR